MGEKSSSSCLQSVPNQFLELFQPSWIITYNFDIKAYICILRENAIDCFGFDISTVWW